MEILIPRVKQSNNEYEIFKQVEAFHFLADRLVKKGPTEVMKLLIQRRQLPVPDIVNLNNILQEACFQYCPPTDLTDTIVCKQLPDGERLVLPKWQKERMELKTLMWQNTGQHFELCATHEVCWRSRLLVEKYSTKVESARSLFNLTNSEKRQKKLNKLLNILTEKQNKYGADVFKYEQLYAKQAAIREKLQQRATALEEEIQCRIHLFISKALDKLHSVANIDMTAFDFNSEQMAKNLVNMSAKTYSWIPHPYDKLDNCFHTHDVKNPEYAKSSYSDLAINKVTRRAVAGEKLVAIDTIKPVHKFDLPVRKGATLVEVRRSADSSKGFGWSKVCCLLPKKWGFYQVALTTESESISCCKVALST